MPRKKNTVYYCGKCFVCGTSHHSDEGGWIVNAELKNLCHSKEKSCFDEYLGFKRASEPRRV